MKSPVPTPWGGGERGVQAQKNAVVQHFSCTTVTMIPYSALVLSLKILFSTLQFPDLSLLILFPETYFPNCLILIRYVIVPQNVSDQSNIQRPYPHNKQLYPFYEGGKQATGTNDGLSTTESLCNNSVFQVFDSDLCSLFSYFSKGCQPCTACYTGIKDNTSVNLNIASNSSFQTHLEAEAVDQV